MGHRKMKPITASGWIDPQLWEKVKGIHLYSLAKRNHVGRSTSMFHLYIIKATKPICRRNVHFYYTAISAIQNLETFPGATW
jgi:hypothetical protein